MADTDTRDPASVVEAQRDIQKEVAEDDREQAQGKGGAAQLGAREYPVPPFPEQHQAKPGKELKLDPAPMYEAPFWKGSGKLDGKVALITGGDSGIGRAVAVLFAREGADVAIAHLAEDADAEETRAAVEAEGRRAIVIRGNVADRDFCREAVARTVRELGRIDVLVNNAAFQVHTQDFLDLSPEHFDETIKTNLYGYFHLAQAAAAEMKPGSAIINDRLGDRHRRLEGPRRLFDDQGRHPRLHPRAVGQPAAARHPGELRRAGAGLDAAEPVGQGAGEGGALRGEDPDEAAGAARGDRARLRLPRLPAMLELHHRGDPADRRRLLSSTGERARGRMALESYRAKRDFRTTAEPAGSDRRGEGDAFVVQKHAARRLHYDLRLEIGDTLASWAVTKGPSLVPAEKRLAVRVEDHPLDYADFEGSIPKGQYGGGEVIVWDRGRWEPEGDPARGLKKGRLDFTLEGAKLKGRWHLVRMGARRGEKRENWLLIKGGDAAARTADAPDILAEAPASVISGRTVEDIAAGRPRRRPGRPRPGRAPTPGPGSSRRRWRR